MPLNFSGAFYFSERFVGNLERIKKLFIKKKDLSMDMSQQALTFAVPKK